MPSGNLEKCIDSNQKVELVRLPQLSLQSANSFQRIIRCARLVMHPRFEIGGDKCWMPLCGERNHSHAVNETGRGLILLVRWGLGGNEQHFPQFESLAGALGDGDVSAMNGIEGTAEEGEIHRDSLRHRPF